MAAVGIHLQDEMGTVSHRLCHPGAVGAAQTVLLGTVQDEHPAWTVSLIDARCQVLGEVTRTVGAGVVDNEQSQPGQVDLHEAVDHARQVGRLVVGRHHHGQGRHCPGSGQDAWKRAQAIPLFVAHSLPFFGVRHAGQRTTGST